MSSSSVSLSAIDARHSIVNVVNFGAKASGNSKDNTAAFARAVATGLSVFVPKPKDGNYYKADITLQDDQTIFGYGAEVRPATVIALKHGNRSVSDGINYTGNGKTDIGTNVIGVSALGKVETKTQNVTIKDFKGDAYQRNECVDRHQGNHLSNFVIKDNVTGINEGTRSEYNKTAIGSIFGNDTGLRIKGGNNNYSAVTVTDNLTGVHLVGGANDAHGVCSGLTINHNTVNIFTDNITVSAFNFSGCEVYAGDIHLLNSNGVTFTGCELSIVEIKEENARYCHFASCHFVSSVTVSPNYNGTFSEVYYHNSNIYNDVNMKRPVFFPEGSYSLATLENNMLNIAAGSAVNVLDTAKQNAISGNPAFAWQGFFSSASKKFDGTKKTRVDGSLIHFTGEVNVARAGSYLLDDDISVELYSAIRGVVAKGFLSRQSDNGSGVYVNVYRFDAKIKRENDEYELRVVNKTLGTVNVYRNQSGDYVCYCEVWGW